MFDPQVDVDEEKGDDEVDQFFSVVRELSVLDPDGLIGVHCTHGVNRTGYMICRYMIEKNGLDPDEAIDRFDKSRGHRQERDIYLLHLRTKSWVNNSEARSRKRKNNFDTSGSGHDTKIKREQNNNSNESKDQSKVTSWGLQYSDVNSG